MRNEPLNETHHIINRHGDNMSVRILSNDTMTENTLFYLHGRGGHMDSPHNRAIIDAFVDRGFRVIALNATNSYPPNESDGDMSTFTIDQHVSDMEDAVLWASENGQIQGQICLAGHSVGGMAALKLSIDELQDKTHAVFAFSPPVSMQQQLDYKYQTQPENMADGFYEDIDNEGQVQKIFVGTMKDQWGDLDLSEYTDALDCPVFIFTGSDDKLVSPNDITEFSNTLPAGLSDLVIIEGADHSFSGKLDSLAASITKAHENLTAAQPTPDIQTDAPGY